MSFSPQDLAQFKRNKSGKRGGPNRSPRKLPERYGGFEPCNDENGLVKAILAFLSAQPEVAFAWRQNNVGVYDPKTKRHRKFIGWKGFPDVAFLTTTGKLGGIECKKKGNKASDAQEECGKVMLSATCVWACVYSFDQFLHEWNKQKKKIEILDK